MSAPFVNPIQKFIATFPEYLQIEFNDWIASLGKTADDVISWEAYQKSSHPDSARVKCNLTVTFVDESKHERVFKRDILKEMQ
jgi:hypothetical protein